MLKQSAARAPGRVRIAVGAAVVLALGGTGAAVASGLLAPGSSVQTLPPITATPRVTGAASTPAGVIVQVLGRVRRPGVYELFGGARAMDAVSAAGGFASNADQSGLNLAARVVDGQQIIVPARGDAAPTMGSARGSADGTPSAGAKVNLNTASEAELETLPRVGPSMAQRIIAWREANGGFASVDDLKNVTGIGDKTFAALAELVTV